MSRESLECPIFFRIFHVPPSTSDLWSTYETPDVRISVCCDGVLRIENLDASLESALGPDFAEAELGISSLPLPDSLAVLLSDLSDDLESDATALVKQARKIYQ